ncbi:MAG: hypothetical protein OXF98_00980 [Rhodospirillaceae bacterium]|nr:hypothetical protein [Rhodospirillaceae bacterium]
MTVKAGATGSSGAPATLRLPGARGPTMVAGVGPSSTRRTGSLPGNNRSGR